MINSRDINELIPPVREMALAFIRACADAGIEVLITSTYRDFESQNALYALGRTNKKTNPRKVTNARAGQSYHNFRCAFDFVPVLHGKALWNNLDLFRQCGEIAESCGLEWAGRWNRFAEMALCQYTGGLTLAKLRSGASVV